MTQTNISELSQRLDGIAAEVTAFALHPRASGKPNRVLAARELGSLKGTVDGLIAVHAGPRPPGRTFWLIAQGISGTRAGHCHRDGALQTQHGK